MKSYIPPVLLTSCITVSDHSVSLKDEESRIHHTLESIKKWLSNSSAMKIVTCDGSSFDLSDIVKAAFPGANIECLNFRNSANLVALYGKGYGEGEIVKYALANSKHLAECDYFAKCTGKLWVENYAECLAGWNGRLLCHGVFNDVFSFRKTHFRQIDTRFFIVHKEFYNDTFSSAYLRLTHGQRLSIEDHFLEIVREKNLEGILFSVPPVICGVGGGNGFYYKNNIKRRLKDQLRLKIVKSQRSFRSLFN